MLECKTCEHNAENDRENCWPCLEAENDRYLSEKNWDADVCYSCGDLFKEEEVCANCIFSVLKKCCS